MRRILGMAAFALTILGGCRESSTANGEVVRVPDEVSCRRCTIELEPVVTLAAPAGPFQRPLDALYIHT